MESNNSIVCLTRGYDSVKGYDSLIKRNLAIKKWVNQEGKYPLIIFHEGNIDTNQQIYIRERSGEQTLEFVNIADVWVGGYESMCRFHAYWIWEYCKNYDNVLRIDEDCWLENTLENPFDMGENVYLKSTYWDECHTETNATLPGRVEELTGIPQEVFYNRKYPYTNISVSSVAFWRQEEVTKVLKELALCEDQIKNRWGDLPILGALLNIYAIGKVGTIKGLEYYHHSHNVTVKSDEVN